MYPKCDALSCFQVGLRRRRRTYACNSEDRPGANGGDVRHRLAATDTLYLRVGRFGWASGGEREVMCGYFPLDLLVVNPWVYCDNGSYFDS